MTWASVSLIDLTISICSFECAIADMLHLPHSCRTLHVIAQNDPVWGIFDTYHN